MAETGLPRREVFFADSPTFERGQRLCVWTAPANEPARNLILHVHAFGDEMNKSRRMTALQAIDAARVGCAVLQVDLHGCGDSSGEFEEATWDTWLADVRSAARLAVARHAQRWPTAAPPTCWMWGHRVGALLAAQSIKALDPDWRLLLWHPVAQGKSFLQQLLRVRSAAEKMRNASGATVAQLRARLHDGEALDLAGYRVTAAMADALEAASLPPTLGLRQVCWLEVSAGTEPSLLPASSAIADRWRQAGAHVMTRVVPGPAFWQTTEIEDAPALISATREVVTGS